MPDRDQTPPDDADFRAYAREVVAEIDADGTPIPDEQFWPVIEQDGDRITVIAPRGAAPRT